ncbi:MAG: EF-hand domain-containing protein [Methylobacter sp.]|nr:EF-hand domain-containing protein [Methylobacter sp.]MDP2427583.1 EF-hand domain-containing protein [Methylobacter sp.]MDP3053118.1 EF-hand domain-containing protein [Methylobacter sp.]MDP3363877.1 EF-hand domain-containing protein [Methylobacter sp.]MDZ4220689.1 EF-hand domain-containing protein [Methylobacter sp.]
MAGIFYFGISLSISFGFVSNPVKAENAGSEKPHRGYKYIEPKGLAAKPGSVSQGTSESPAATDTDAKKTNSGEQAKTPHENNGAATTDLSTKDVSTEKTTGGDNATSGEQNSQAEPVTKPTDGKGAYPTFSQADVNGDNYITKEELKNYPHLLQVFDKVDAGNDGKLEQHEYQNLEMETKREGQIR